MDGPATILFDTNGNPLTTLADGSLLITIADGYVSFASTPSVDIVNFPVSQTINGVVSVSNLPATQPVSVSNFPAIQSVSQSGVWSVITNKSSTSSVVAVSPSTTNTVLFAANPSRVFAHISNGSNKSLFVKLGTTASLTSYTDVVLSGNSYDVPQSYVGIVSGIWGAGVNATQAMLTELS